jgi:SNF2 family DNA or RNA helicase
MRPEYLQAIVDVFPEVVVDPLVEAQIATIVAREQATQKEKMAGWQKAKAVEPMPVITNPFSHQIAGFNLGIKLPAFGLLYEQGCGKTLTAIAIAGRRFQKGEIARVLIVAPASVVPVWPAEFQTHADFKHDVRALEGSTRKREGILQGWRRATDRLQVAVINYEATWRMEEALEGWLPDLIICDESQRIKTPGARQSKTMHRLGRHTKYRLILTGTPVSQGPLDFFSQYKFLDPSIFGGSYYSFRARYARMGGYEKRQVVGYQNLPELIRKAHSIALRVTKDEALDLPECTDQVLYCQLEPEAARLYKEMKKESVAELEGNAIITAGNVLAKLMRLSQIAGGYANDEDGNCRQVSTAKIRLLEETVDDILGAGKKVVIFARFLPELKAMRKFLEDRSIQYSYIAGEVPQEQRGPEVDRFQTDPDTRVFLAQIQTAGLGITLTAADTAIFYSEDFNYANLDQAKARLHRIGQRNAVTNIFLVARDTVDEKILEALQAKKNVAREVVDNWRAYF